MAIANEKNTRPAPAATDMGLVTVGYMAQTRMGWIPSCASSGGEAVVTRSQAEELLAEKDAEIKECHENINLKADFIEKTIGQLHEAEADNAAQAARINFLERLVKEQETQIVKSEALEAKLAAAEKVLLDIAAKSSDPWASVTAKLAITDSCAVLGGKP